MTLKNQPVLKIPSTILEKISTVLSLLLLILNVIYLLIQWGELPNQVPIHFGVTGEADGWGGKGMIWFLPIMAFLLWIGLTLLERVPHLHNYSGLTEENVESQYRNSRMMLNVMKTEIIIFMVLGSYQSVQVAHGHQFGLGIWELPIFLGVMFSTMGFFMYRAFKLKQTSDSL
ncbi:DUF1648 domain-containing protein [Bacillus sp. REN10]|uniref:DUF1648 domain-containing protein n=1 Tax=Bacillus sp. REN10 TaxID=2782541 RepID=UPI00193B9265|nr:DUF1648 domain-containing protein [Bacillus sp. REN10]